MKTIANRNSLGAKLASIVTSAALVLSFIPCVALPQVALADEAVSIGTAAELTALATAVNGGDDYAGKTVQLTADIDLSGIADWDAIGNGADKAFAGTFDGNDHAITGLTVNSASAYKGLFGKNTGTIKDFTLAGTVTSTTSNGDYVGGVVAYNMGTVSGVTSSVTVSASGAYNVGGIAGFNDGGYNATGGTAPTGGQGTISQCATTGNVTGQSKVGGIAGENSGLVSQCYATGTIDGTNASSKNGVGGIVGRNGNNNTALESGTIDSCYFIGTVGRTGQKWVGGIAGFNSGIYGNASATPSTIKNCYMAGTLVVGAGYYNAIAGNNEGAANTSNNYSLEGITGSGSSAAEAGIVKTAAELKSAETVALLNGEGSAYAAVEGAYPVLAWQIASPEPEPAEATAQLATTAEGVRTGDTFTVDIVVTNEDAISAASAELSYNPEIATITEIKYAEDIENGYLGQGEGAKGDFNNETGNAKVSFLGEKTYNVAEGKVIATVTFSAVKDGAASIAITAATAAVSQQTADIDLALPEVPLVIAVDEAIAFTLYTCNFDGSNVQVAKAYTMTELQKLVDASADAIAGQYTKNGLNVYATTNYVTFADLAEDAGATWATGYSVTYGGDASQGKAANTFTYDALQGRYFYPAAAVDAEGAITFDATGRVETPFSLALTANVVNINKDAAGTAASAKEAALAGQGTENTMVTILGASDEEVAAKSIMGKPFWRENASMTILAPDPTPVFEVAEDLYAGTYYQVTYIAPLAEGKVPSMNGQAMYQVGDKFVALVNATEAAALTNANFSVAAGEADVVVRDGDVNANGKVNIVDAQVAYDVATNVHVDFSVLSMKQWLSADVNNNGAVQAADAVAIQYKVHNGAFGA